MIEEFINSALTKYPANKDDIFISLVGFGSTLKIVFTTGLVLDFEPPNQLTIPHYSQVKEEIAEDFIDFETLNLIFGIFTENKPVNKKEEIDI